MKKPFNNKILFILFLFQDFYIHNVHYRYQGWIRNEDLGRTIHLKFIIYDTNIINYSGEYQ